MSTTRNVNRDRFADQVDIHSFLGASFEVTAGTTSASLTVSSSCEKVLVHCKNNPAAFRVGIGPQTAINTDHYIASGETRTFRVPPGATLAFIKHGGSDGIIHVSELL
jgi:hypothetical protein